MAPLMPSKAKGMNVHRIVVPPVHGSGPSFNPTLETQFRQTPSSAQPSASSTPFDTLSSHVSGSHKRKVPSDIPGQSSTSKKRKQATGVETLQGLQGAFVSLSDTIRLIADRPSHAPSPLSITSASEATCLFINSIKASNESGDAWLSEPEVYRAIRLLEDERTATLYLAISQASEGLKRQWIIDHLKDSDSTL